MRTHTPTGLQRLAGLGCLLLVAAVVGLGGSAAFAARTQTVTIGATLSPKALTVTPGTTVTWSARDAGKHKVRSTSGPVELKSDDIVTGQSWSFTFTAPGTYRYVDDEHKDNPALQGTVTVRAAGSGPGTTPAPGVPGAPAPNAPASARVSIAGKAFSPASVTVAVGGVVTWTNNDSMPHNVTSNSGAFQSTTLNPGQTFRFTFRSPGTYPYVCTFHSGMRGTVIVPTATGSVPAPAPAHAPRVTTAHAPSQHAIPATATHGQTKTYRVQVKDNSFSPSTVHARVGDTITWVNMGQMPHTVTAADGAFDHQLSPGQTFSYALRAQGTVPYVCSFHPGMAGTLVVGAPLAGVKVPPKVADTAGGSAGTGAGTVPAAAAPASHGKTKTVEIKVNEMSFTPAMAKANVGDTISWVNVGSIPHTVTANDGSFDKTPLAPGERYNYVVTKQGEFPYVCSYHPGMDGMLMVGPALAGVSVPPASGSAETKPLSKAPASSGTAKTYEIEVKDSSFNPAMLNARVGDTISWVNLGNINHTVTAKDHSFDVLLKPGHRFNLVLTKQGNIDYVCTPHHSMFGMLMVGPARAAAAASLTPRTLGALPSVAKSGIGLALLILLGILASAQVRARVSARPSRRDATGEFS